VDIYLVNTPFHFFSIYHKITEKDKIVIIDEFNYQQSVLLEFINSEGIDRQILYIKGFSLRKQSKIISCFNIKSDIENLVSFIKQKLVNNVYLFVDTNPINQLIISKLHGYAKKIVLIEEGIGLYRDNFKINDIFKKIIGKLIFGNSYEKLRRVGEYKYIDVISCKYPYLLNLKQRKKQIVSNNEYSVLKSLEYIDKYIHKIDADYIFVSQPLNEDGLVSKDKYLNFLEDVINTINSKGKKIAIKMHPREIPEKFQFINKQLQFKLIENKIPLELLLIGSKAKVLTVFSSVAFNVSQDLNIESVLLYKLLKFEPNIPNQLLLLDNIKVLSDLEELQ
jgi:Alpha-2,8-polysialyltransferase (POLYST)